MKIKYISSVGTRNLKFLQRVTARRVPFTNYIVSHCNWTVTKSRKILIEIRFEETPSYVLVRGSNTLISKFLPYSDEVLFPMNHKKVNIYRRMGVLDLIWLGWIYLRRERETE